MSGMISLENDHQRLFDAMQRENDSFLSQQLITYIGNKRGLLNFIRDGIERVQIRLNKDKVSAFDVFSGSGIVARLFKQYASIIYVNDLEDYSRIINECYLTNKNQISISEIKGLYLDLLEKIESSRPRDGFITRLYSPGDDGDIKKGERAFYTRRNAQYIDTARQLIHNVSREYQRYFLGPLLSEASIHANTSGVFKGFYKCKKTGKGKFGGSHNDALFRITGDIQLRMPVLSDCVCEYAVYQGDANHIINTVPEVDIAYIDPPYNQHPYGSNYFMLNLIANYKEPLQISDVSGIPVDWNRSDYNKRHKSFAAFSNLVEHIKAKFLLISFNSEGFLSSEKMLGLLRAIGKVEVLERTYNAFRGSRNLRNRNIHVKEFLYVVEKS